MDTPPLSTPQDPFPNPPVHLNGRQWKVILHLSALCFFIAPGFGNILGPLVVWLLKKDQLPDLEPEGRKVLNFQISWSIYMILAGLSWFFCIGAVLTPVVVLVWLVILIIGAVKTSNGEAYTFPLTIKIL